VSDHAVSWFCIGNESCKEVAGGFLRIVLHRNIWIRKPMRDAVAQTGGGKGTACFWEQNMGAAEVLAGRRMGPGRQRLLITAPGSAENGSRGVFLSVALFPSCASAQITSFWQCSRSLSRTDTLSGCRCGSCSQGAMLKCLYGRK